ncbi:MAG: hypothetical protein AB7Y46_14100 [Armatimonadota bacterium]
MRLTTDERRHVHDRAYEALRAACGSRYPVVLVLGVDEQVSTQLWLDFAADNELTVVDLLEWVEQPEFQRAATAWPTLVDWIREQAVAHGGVLVLGLDDIATQWTEPARQRLYYKLLKSETRRSDTGAAAPIVAVSRLALDYRIPDDARNQGVIVNLQT